MLFFQPLNDMRENVCGITITTNHNNTNLKGEKRRQIHWHLDSWKQPEREYSKSTTGEAQLSKYWRNQYNSGNRNSIVQNNLWWHLINQTRLFTCNTTEYRLPLVVLCAPFFFLLSLSIVPRRHNFRATQTPHFVNLFSCSKVEISCHAVDVCRQLAYVRSKQEKFSKLPISTIL